MRRADLGGRRAGEPAGGCPVSGPFTDAVILAGWSCADPRCLLDRLSPKEFRCPSGRDGGAPGAPAAAVSPSQAPAVFTAAAARRTRTPGAVSGGSGHPARPRRQPGSPGAETRALDTGGVACGTRGRPARLTRPVPTPAAGPIPELVAHGLVLGLPRACRSGVPSPRPSGPARHGHAGGDPQLAQPRGVTRPGNGSRFFGCARPGIGAGSFAQSAIRLPPSPSTGTRAAPSETTANPASLTSPASWPRRQAQRGAGRQRSSRARLYAGPHMTEQAQ